MSPSSPGSVPPSGARLDLGEPEVLQTRPDGVRILRVRSPAEVGPYRANFAGAYQAIFSEPPYNERFFPSEAEGILKSLLEVPDHITLLAVKGITQVVGFGIGVPATAKGDVTRELRGLLSISNTYYLAELGVLPAWRGTGLGSDLVRMRLDLIDRARFSNVVLRTSAIRNTSYDMYMGLGFEDMGVYMEVPSRRTDGTVTTDRRLFLCKVLPKPDASDEDVSDPETWLPGG